MKTVSIAVNLAIFVITAALLLTRFRHEGRWMWRRGLKAFRFFTVLSNAFSALAALTLALCELRGDAPAGALMFKYMATVSVTITLLTVLLFLGPTQGYGPMLHGENLFMHLIGPLMAIGSYGLLEKQPLSLPQALLGVVPVALYGVVYYWKVIAVPEPERWDDFYGFNKGGRWPIACAAMGIGSILLCLLYWRL